MEQKLQKSATDKILFGVCGGLAEYFDIDPVIIRALFAFVTVAGGSGLFIYIILAIIMPEKNSTAKTQKEVITENTKDLESKIEEAAENVGKAVDSNRSRQVFGIILIAIGFIFFFETMGVPYFGYAIKTLLKLWPLIFVVFGILILTKKNEK
jgi:phage shock protein C